MGEEKGVGSLFRSLKLEKTADSFFLLNFVLSGASKAAEKHVSESSSDLADEEGSDKPLSHSIPSKEMDHV